MSLHKNTGLTALDVGGGRMLPVGAAIDLDPGDPTVADHVADGRLTAVQGAATARRTPATPPEES